MFKKFPKLSKLAQLYVQTCGFSRYIKQKNPKLGSRTINQTTFSNNNESSNEIKPKTTFENPIKQDINDDHNPTQQFKKSSNLITEERGDDRSHNVNKQILVYKNLPDLFEFYQERKFNLDPVNHCTILHRAVEIAKNEDSKIKDKINMIRLANHPQILEIISYLKDHLSVMNSFSISNFIANLARLKIKDMQVIDTIIQITLDKKITHGENAISHLLCSMAQYKINNKDFLNLCKDMILKKDKLALENATNIFWAISILDYNDKPLIDKLEAIIENLAPTLTLDQTTMLFMAYNSMRRKNFQILDILSSKLIRELSKCSIKILANIANYCANLNYVNALLFTSIEKEILNRLKQTSEYEELKKKDDTTDEFGFPLDLDKNLRKDNNKDNDKEINNKTQESTDKKSNVSKEIEKAKPSIKDITPEVINTYDISQILVAFCKLKSIKTELFQLLEVNFIKNLADATPQSIIAYAFAHSSLCQDMISKYTSKKNLYLKRSLKNIKKYNNTFYEVVLPFVEMKIDQFKIEEVLSLLVSACRPQIKKRAICRLIMDVGIKTIPKFKLIAKEYNALDYEKLIYRYNTILQKFSFKEDYKVMTIEAFNNIGIDITRIDVAYAHLLTDEKINEGLKLIDEKDDNAEVDADIDTEETIEEKKIKEQRKNKMIVNDNDKIKNDNKNEHSPNVQ